MTPQVNWAGICPPSKLIYTHEIPARLTPCQANKKRLHIDYYIVGVTQI